MPDFKLIWMFHGPHAEGTAGHYLKHLEQFADAQNIQLREKENKALDAYSTETFVICDESAKNLIVQRLKPHRIIPLENSINPDAV